MTFGIQNAFLGTVGVVLVRLIVRNAALALAITVVVFAPLAAAGQIQTDRLWLDLLFGAALVAIIVGTVLQWGVVAGAIAFIVHFLTWSFALTLDSTRFFFGVSTGVVVSVALLAVVGFVLSRAREPVLGRWLPE